MITLRQYPDLWTPIYNPMVFVLDSTNTAQSNFKYVADVYISGVSDYIRLTCDADPVYSQGIFDIHRIAESYVSSTPGFKTLSGFLKANNSSIAYEVKFGEQYGVASAVTVYPMLTVTGTKYAYNGSLAPHDWLDFDGADFAIEDSGTTLTDQPNARVTTMNGNEDSYIHYVSNTSGTVYYAEIKTYGSTGALIGTYRIENDYQDVAAYDQRRMIFYSGVRGLNAATLALGSQPVIDSSVYSYTVNLINFAGTSALNSVITFTKNTDCLSERTPISLHWKNHEGGFDTLQFDRINRYKTETTKNTYERRLGSMTQNAWSFLESDSGRVVMDTTIKPRYDLQSNWISLDDSLYVMGLIESPEVYMDDGGGFRACTIVSPTTAELKSVSFGDTELQSLKVTIEMSVDYWRQRG